MIISNVGVSGKNAPEHLIERLWTVRVDFQPVAMGSLYRLDVAQRQAGEPLPQIWAENERHVAIRQGPEQSRFVQATHDNGCAGASEARHENMPIVILGFVLAR